MVNTGKTNTWGKTKTKTDKDKKRGRSFRVFGGKFCEEFTLVTDLIYLLFKKLTKKGRLRRQIW